MRNVYQLPDLEFEPNQVGLAVSLVPEAVRWTLEFRRGDSPWAARSHLLDRMDLVFSNGTNASIDGAFLWKFRDSIPPGFGSDDVGYLDENPHGEGTVEELVKRLRMAHDAFFVGMQPSSMAKPPLRVCVDTLKQTFETVVPHEVPKPLQTRVRRLVQREFARSLGECDRMLADTLRQMFERGRGRFERRPDAVYTNMLRNVLVHDPWPRDAMRFPLSEMLAEFDSRPDDPHGPTPSLNDRLATWLSDRANAWFKRFAAGSSEVYWDLREHLGWARRGMVSPSDLRRTLSESVCPRLLDDEMLRLWHRDRGTKTVEWLMEQTGV